MPYSVFVSRPSVLVIVVITNLRSKLIPTVTPDAAAPQPVAYARTHNPRSSGVSERPTRPSSRSQLRTCSRSQCTTRHRAPPATMRGVHTFNGTHSMASAGGV